MKEITTDAKYLPNPKNYKLSVVTANFLPVIGQGTTFAARPARLASLPRCVRGGLALPVSDLNTSNKR
jgi:hypothetical protein